MAFLAQRAQAMENGIFNKVLVFAGADLKFYLWHKRGQEATVKVTNEEINAKHQRSFGEFNNNNNKRLDERSLNIYCRSRECHTIVNWMASAFDCLQL